MATEVELQQTVPEQEIIVGPSLDNFVPSQEELNIELNAYQQTAEFQIPVQQEPEIEIVLQENLNEQQLELETGGALHHPLFLPPIGVRN